MKPLKIISNSSAASSGKPSLTIPLLLAAALLPVGVSSLHAARTYAASTSSSSAAQAWRTLKHNYETPPPPLKQLPDRMYTQKEIREYYTRTANRAGAVADAAKQFYSRYPNHPQAAKAREIYFNMLYAAVGLSSTSKITELESVTTERLKDPKLNDDARFQLSLRLLQSAVGGKQYESDDAMRAELEKRARQLARDYPSHPDGDNYLLNLARAAAPEKSASLARELLTSAADEKMKAECRGLIARSTAINKPLTLSLALKDAKTLDLDQLQGKVVLLLFWDSSSRFSPKALWAVNELYKTYHPKGLEVVGLNFDEDQSKAMEALKDASLEWPQYFDMPTGWKVRDRFGVHTTPMCWFVDKKGVLRELNGERDPEGILKKLLSE